MRGHGVRVDVTANLQPPLLIGLGKHERDLTTRQNVSVSHTARYSRGRTLPKWHLNGQADRIQSAQDALKGPDDRVDVNSFFGESR